MDDNQAGTTPKTPNALLGVQLPYSVGQIAGQVFRDAPSLLLLIYLTNVIGIEPALAGAAIFLPKLVVGVLADVTVGIIADRWRQRIPDWYWLLAGAILALIAMGFLFRVPDAAVASQIIFIVVVFSFYMAAFSIFSVPYFAMAPILAQSPHQRTILMAWRLAFTAIGVLVAAGAAPAFVASRGGGQDAYEELGLMLGVLCALSLVIALLGVRHAASTGKLSSPVITEALTLPKLKRAFLMPRFSVLLGVNILQLAASGMSYAALLYFLIYNMQRADAFTLIGGLVFITAIGILCAQPMWVYLAKQFGKKRVYVASTFMYGAVLFVWAVTSGVSLPFTYMLAFLVGVGNSGWALLGFSMVSDITAEGQGGIYSAAWMAGDKIGFAVGGTIMIGFTLSAFGFSAADAVAGLPQSQSAKTGIMVAFGVFPGIIQASAALLFARWGIETAAPETDAT